jgi:hypothetical protein
MAYPYRLPVGCEECSHQGYFVSEAEHTDGTSDFQVERCDTCASLLNDDAAAVRFVRGLEKGDAYALKVLRDLEVGLCSD